MALRMLAEMLQRQRRRVRKQRWQTVARWGLVVSLLVAAWVSNQRSNHSESMGFASAALVHQTSGIVPLAAAAVVAGAQPITKKNGKRGAIYARYSSKMQRSIADQIRVCQEWGDANGVTILPQHIFTDEAATGRSSNRAGLLALEAALKAGEIDVLIVFSTSRLFRKTSKTLNFLDEHIVEPRRRAVFVHQAIDSDDKDFWDVALQFYSMMDERMVRMQAAMVRAGQEGLAIQDLQTGTRTYGYQAIDVPGALTKKGKPRRKWVIDGTEAVWVRRIFQWFLGEDTPTGRCMNYAAIARRLNTEGAPLTPKCQTGVITPLGGGHILKNRRYIGDWSYGWSESIWQGKADYSRQYPLDKPHREHNNQALRLIDDLTYYRAQERIAELAKQQSGRENGRAAHHACLFEKLLWCEAHQRYLWTQGKRHRTYWCPECKRSTSPSLVSLFPEMLGAQLICHRVGEILVTDRALVPQIVAAFTKAAETRVSPDPAAKEQRQKTIQVLTRKIDFIYDSPAETEQDQSEQKERLRSLQIQRQQATAELSTMESKSEELVVPSEDEARQRVKDLAETFTKAATSTDEEAVLSAHKLLNLATDGKIVLTQQGPRNVRRGWLRAAFTINAARMVGPSELEFTALPFEIDIRDDSIAAERAERARQLYEAGASAEEAAKTLGIGENKARALPTSVRESLGESRADARKRRERATGITCPPRLVQRIADQVKSYADQGMPMQAIASSLGLNRDARSPAPYSTGTPAAVCPTRMVAIVGKG
jgi:DNA invertase Pin-like site-specific DNA recombinase